MKKIMSFVLLIALISRVILPTFSVSLNIFAEEAYTGVINNGGSEEMSYPFVDGGQTATNTHNSDEVHSGNYSTKIVTSTAGMDASFKIESTTNYDKIPLEKEVYITFWAKADETNGFKGSIFTGNVYQTGANGISNKLDNYMLTFAAGSGSAESGWVEFDKEWKQYFIKVQKPFADGYTGCYSFIKLCGKGTLYIDDFDIIDLNSESTGTDIIDNASSELTAYEAYGDTGNPAEHSSDEAHSGSYSTKIFKKGSIKITSSANYSKIPLDKEVHISFWAKADENVGYKGAIYTGNVYQTGTNGTSNKLDNYMLTFAAGSAIIEDGWVEFGKEWKQYFIKVQKPFADGYTGMYSFINFDGQGVLYLDDFDVVDMDAEIVDTNIIDNASSEIKAFGDTGTPTEHSSDEAHSGSYSTKISTNGSIKITSSANYSKIPLNKEVHITFWAKADETVGYKGTVYTGNIYQTGVNGASNKLDNQMLTFAAGSATTEDGWVEFEKEWKKYSIKVQKPFKEGYTGMYSYINFDGQGVLYLDDFDIVDLNSGNDDIIDNAGSELKAYEAYDNSAEQTSEEAHSGSSSTKIFKNGSIRITSTTNYDKIPLGKDVFITFYAKADANVGFKGAMGSGNIYQVADDGTSLKLDGWATSYAFGSTLSEDEKNLWEELSTEWTKYYIKVLHNFDIGYSSMYSFINFVGEGVLYIDDFNIETAGEGSGSDNPLKVEISDDVNGARYYESTADGTFSIEQKVVIKNLTSSFESGLCEYIVTDSMGDEISSGDFDIAIGPQSTSTYAVDCSSVAAYGTYTVDFSVTRTDGSQYYVGKINLSRIKEVEKVNSQDMLGINFHHGEVAEDQKNELREQLKPLAAMGVNTVRTSFHWTDYEKEKGVYNFTQNLKNYFEVCAEFNMVVAPVLKESAEHAVGNTLYANGDLNAAESIEGYGNFCAAFIEYLGDYAKYALISNEPNFCDVPVDVYTKMLKSAYTKIKKVNPSVKVVGGEISGWGMTYITDMLELGAYGYMDAIGIHPYIYPSAPEVSKVIDTLKEVAQLTADYSTNDKPLPIWCDEYGYFTSGKDNAYSPVTEEQQAVYMTRYTAMMAASGLVEMAMPYVAYDMYDNVELSEGNYGIIRHSNSDKGSYTSKPAHLMLAGYMNALGGKKFKSVLSNDAGMYAYLYSSGDKENVYMLWDNGNDVRCTVKVSGGNVSLYDCFGNSKYVKMNGNSLNVTIGQRPIYLVLDSGATVTDITLGSDEDINDDSSQEDVHQDTSVGDTDSQTDEFDDNKKTEEEKPNKTKKKKVIITKKVKGSSEGFNVLPIIIAVCAVVLVGGGAAVFLIARRKKSKSVK